MRFGAPVFALLVVLVSCCGSAEDEASTIQESGGKTSVASATQVGMDGQVTAVVTLEEWMFLGAGTPVGVGGEERPLPWDGAMLSIELTVANKFIWTIQLRGSQFVVVGENGRAVSQLQLLQETERGPEFTQLLKVETDSESRLILNSTLSPLSDFTKGGKLRLVHSAMGWSWEIAAIPEGREKFAESIKNGCYYSLEPRITAQRWIGMVAGRMLKVQGTDARLSNDVAGLEVAIEVHNVAENAVRLSRHLTLATASGEPLAPLHLEREGVAPEPIPARGIAIAAGETVTLRLGSRMVSYDELRSSGSLVVRQSDCGWSLPLDPLPERAVLYAEESAAQKDDG